MYIDPHLIFFVLVLISLKLSSVIFIFSSRCQKVKATKARAQLRRGAVKMTAMMASKDEIWVMVMVRVVVRQCIIDDQRT